MRWRSGSAPRRLWNPKFAWLPIRVGFTWVWLERVDRRFDPGKGEHGGWEHRLRKRVVSECDGTEYYR
jgi:hypothetical protein